MFRNPAAAVFLALASSALADEPSIERLDPALDGLLDAKTPIETLGEGYEWSEGPVWDKSSGELLFSDVPNNVVHAWKQGSGVRVYMKPSGYTGVADYGREPGSNGLAFDAEGRLLSCEHGDRRVSVLTRGGGKMTVADRFEGKRLNSPNDVTVHPDGTLFFTDPIYGLPQHEKDPSRELDFCGVFRIAKDGKVTLVTREIERPNGVALSPDGKTLYVANSHGPRPHIFSIALKPDGTAEAPETFFDTKGLKGSGAPDGLKVDAKGNLWATGPGGLLVITPEGKLLGRVLTGRATANVAFGGEDGKSVFLTADDRILRFTRK
ncbi:SMP-30/gluconolactonase/LRE family protein [Luteolibacter yonseiensis]|uniref:SMP-30/gluconolactonase/LRE family protein n=1 Tax=Luteolibacter yonseiensis TaxID=1144680 RepID=A0A934R0D7_9BACT|nr:SMP-30/gluconolactonase/LRE family protein [Luteolibacter yonseiensis]MBK1816078.1 SMP-30/gluconolactonase/LRE family protein [Luteolibacter yonseiensis]